MWKCSKSAFLAGNSKFPWLTEDFQGKPRKFGSNYLKKQQDNKLKKFRGFYNKTLQCRAFEWIFKDLCCHTCSWEFHHLNQFTVLIGMSHFNP